MQVIKRVWQDGSGHFFHIVSATPDEITAVRAAPNANTWIEEHAEIIDTLPAEVQLVNGEFI